MSKNPFANRKMAEQGKSVRKKLARNPRMTAMGQGGLELFVLDQFLSLADCAGIIAQIDSNARPSTLYTSAAEEAGFRTSYSCDLNPKDTLVEAVERWICEAIGLDFRLGETMQGQRYDVGQQFRPHQDYFPYEAEYWEKERKNGGQRSWTAMIYLNQPEGGGETNFPTAGLCVSPKAGTLLVWNNMLDDGSPNTASLHEGCPVTAGRKYIVTKWFRERFWAVGLR